MKFVYWPTLDTEINKYKIFFEGVVLNAGSGSRPLNLPYASKIINLDIKKTKNVDIVANLNNIPLDNESIDGIINVAVLEHCKNPNNVVCEMSRILKKGGKLLCVVPFMQPIHLSPNDYFRFTPSGIKELLIKNNFKIINLEYTHTLFHIIGWYLEDYIKTTKSLLIKILLYPISLISLILTKYVKFNINSAPCVITILAEKKNGYH